jgi:hypothetical protein
MFSFYRKSLLTPNSNINQYITSSINESMRKKINYYNNEKQFKNIFFELKEKENPNENFNTIITSSSASPLTPSNFYIGSFFLLYITYFFYNKYYNKYYNKLIYK